MVTENKEDLAKFRISVHNLKIERGRYLGLPVKDIAGPLQTIFVFKCCDRFKICVGFIEYMAQFHLTGTLQ